MTRSVSDWLAAAQQQQTVLSQELARVRERRSLHERTTGQLKARRDTALNELTAALLPELTASAVDRAVALTGYSTLVREDPAAAYGQARRALEARAAEIDRDPRYVERETLRDPDAGPYQRELREQEEHLASLTRFLSRAAHPRLKRLLETGYGTEAYDVPWWRLSYYRDWEAGDEVVERFPEHGWETFGPFREHYAEVQRSAHAIGERVASLQGELKAIDALEMERASIEEDLAGGLLRRALEETRGRLRDYLADRGPAALADRLGDAPEVEELAKRWAGLREQVDYLEQVLLKLLVPHELTLTTEIAKLTRKDLKLRRPKNRYRTFTDDEFARQFKDRRPRYQKIWKRYDRVYAPLSGFDRYDRGSLAEDFLWWDLITDGRVDGDWIPEVRRYREAYPGRRWVPDDLSDADAAAAVAAADLSGPDGDLFDPS